MERTEGGYGKVFFKGRKIMVHRMSAHLFWGFWLSSNTKILHKCDNPPCFNPNHLFEGTDRDNVMDAIKKGNRPDLLINRRFCANGHRVSPNTIALSAGRGWLCKLCRRNAYLRWAKKQKRCQFEKLKEKNLLTKPEGGNDGKI